MGQNFPYVLPLRERQTVVLAWHPDHIAGPARSTNVKPIFDGAPPCCHCTLFHARWCACGACYIAGEIAFKIDEYLQSIGMYGKVKVEAGWIRIWW